MLVPEEERVELMHFLGCHWLIVGTNKNLSFFVIKGGVRAHPVFDSLKVRRFLPEGVGLVHHRAVLTKFLTVQSTLFAVQIHLLALGQTCSISISLRIT